MVDHSLSHFIEEIGKPLPAEEPYICPTCTSEYKEKAPLIRHVAFTHRAILDHCKEAEMKGRLVACESDDVVAPELPAVAKGRSAAKKGSYKRTHSDDDFVDDPDSDYSHASKSGSSSGSSDYEYNSGSGSIYSRSGGGGSGSSSDDVDSVDYEEGGDSEDEPDSDGYIAKKPPRKRQKYKKSKRSKRPPSSDEGDSVDYESASEEEQDSDEYNIKKPPRALGWESD